MASNNLRIIYDNLVDSSVVTTTLSASSAALPVSNLTKDTKSLVWRTVSAPLPTGVSLTVNASPALTAVVDGKVIITISSIAAGTTNHIVCNSNTSVTIGKSIVFSGTSSNNIVVGTKYYVIGKSSTNIITIGTSPNASTFKVNIRATFSNPTTIGAIILPFTNLSKTATITVKGYTGINSNTFPSIGSGVDNPTIVTTNCTEVFSTGSVLAAPYSLAGEWSWGGAGTGVNSFSYGGGTHARVYVPLASQVLCTSIVIEIYDQYNTDRYIECSRLVVGNYWSPKYNTQYGLNTSVVDLSSSQRSESGDLVTNRSSMFNKLNFELGYLVPSDRNSLLNILRGSGTSKPIFVSLFPEDEDLEKERTYQIYGKMSQLSPVQNQIMDLYSSSIEIEEV